jgi:hypothetical protein
MAKLYPPTLPGALPATIVGSSSNSGAIMEVPFSLNKSVGINDIQGVRIKVKSITTNSIVSPRNNNDSYLNISKDNITFSQNGKSGIVKVSPYNIGITNQG